MSLPTTLLRNTYYVLKPIIPWNLRMGVRRIQARKIRCLTQDSWPINESAAQMPNSWPGWPGGKKFAFVVTHDVEGRRGLQRCRKLAEMEMSLGLRSSFNFVPEGEEVPSEALRALLGESGFEVGVHDLHHDGSLHRSREDFGKQAQKINQYLRSWNSVGFRAGFMFHNLEWQHELNILYDASTFDTDPFEPQSDGVNTIFPFWVPGKGSKGYVELPYTLAQDSTLFILFQEKSIDVWIKKLEWVAAHGGMALVNVHPDYMSFSGRPSLSEYPVELYERFLKHVLNRYRDDCWFACPRDVAQFVHEFKPSLSQGV